MYQSSVTIKKTKASAVFEAITGGTYRSVGRFAGLYLGHAVAFVLGTLAISFGLYLLFDLLEVTVPGSYRLATGAGLMGMFYALYLITVVRDTRQ